LYRLRESQGLDHRCRLFVKAMRAGEGTLLTPPNLRSA
jgi:hypothetical protein